MIGAPALSLGNIIGLAQGAAGNLEAWFGKVMDRVSQRFTMWMRIWTIVFAFLIAFVGCIDTFQLASDLYTKTGLRSQLVTAAPQVVDIAKSVIPEGTQPLEEAATQGVTQIYTAALNQAVADAKVPPPSPVAAGIASSAAAVQWIQANIPQSQQASVQQAFEAQWQAQMKSRAQDAAQLRTILTSAGLPQFGPSGWLKSGFATKESWQRFIGVLATALLLSLGAPFWYNVLKDLVAFRPALARKEQENRDQRQSMSAGAVAASWEGEKGSL